ncbi:LysM peptidoglycan-binding domain-containing protein [Shewanella inventionis]|uniref:Lytic transglycosylase n=1 Tax=Shewanella inventionis TaxID=1738770 RepID=A0ABQ1IS82_9GAMM|nr:LysM peptidoglycan-binding domain-containing protein [Shewanella inventionis]MCL1157205.1 LysM peptidoglycan-binding domain-containing protein [Shewanella inventionis]UAL41937.1 LysM peptidoglycan-binding domain-containing protein [Shewanella inventionis]GGB49044.1 lytic transglycosylase [Shewanella inventionis]
MKVNLFIIAGTIVAVTGCQTLQTSTVQTDNEPTKVALKAKSKKSATVTLDEIEEQVAEVNNLWLRISKQMSLPTVDNALVMQYKQWYLDNPKHLEIITQRASPFLYYIVEQLEERNLPIELALLPIVESGFDPLAYSSSHASGLWQLTPQTALSFGVKTNWWFDGRQDVASSTKAALDLLQYLYPKMDNNWFYTIAAYNSGEGRLLNAIKRNKAKGKAADFWSLSLPKETAHYVPQLLALADVIKHADKYGITLTPIENTPQIEVVNIESQLDINLAADLAQIDIVDLKAINPGLKRWATAPQGPHQLIVPSDKAATFKRALATIEPESRINWVRYKIKSGDSISRIADQFETTETLIRSSNGIKGNNIIAGKFLIIPVAIKDPDLATMTADQILARKAVVKSSPNKQTYTIKSGDSLWKIAQSQQVSVAQLMKWNNLKQQSTLTVGKNLVIYPNEVTANTSGTEKTVNYRVKSGDSLARIATKYKVTVAELIEWNSLQNSKLIQPGQILKLIVTNS